MRTNARMPGVRMLRYLHIGVVQQQERVYLIDLLRWKRLAHWESTHVNLLRK